MGDIFHMLTSGNVFVIMSGTAELHLTLDDEGSR